MKLDSAWYHLILFISCLVFLAAIILTGHDNSPLVKYLAGGAFGGVFASSGANAAPMLFKFLLGPNDPSAPAPTKQAGFIRLPLAFAMFLAFFLMLPACAALNQAAKTNPVATACATSSAAIKTLTMAKAAGALSTADQDVLNASVAALAPVCTATVEPSLSGAALSAIDSAAFNLGAAASHYSAQ